jgi:hypothetical protein
VETSEDTDVLDQVFDAPPPPCDTRKSGKDGGGPCGQPSSVRYRRTCLKGHTLIRFACPYHWKLVLDGLIRCIICNHPIDPSSIRVL